MQTLWLIQASLSDLAANPTTPQFITCRRVYNRVQHIIFSDPMMETGEPQQVRPRFQPALAGMGILAASFGIPVLSWLAGGAAVEEGRRQVDEETAPSAPEPGSNSDSDDDGRSYSLDSFQKPKQPARRFSLDPPRSPKMSTSQSTRSSKPKPSYLPGAPITLGDSPVISPLPREPLSRRRIVSPKLPQSQSMMELPSPTASHFVDPSSKVSFSKQVSPALSRPPDTAVSLGGAEARQSQLRQKRLSRLANGHSMSTPSLTSSSPGVTLPPHLLMRILRSYACRSQLDLITKLQDISTRLVVVPKVARLSALRAELTVLNHSLPRGCCLCIGCPGKGGRHTAGQSIFSPSMLQYHPHQRIVRISPSEAVVLNSADRAPFLILVEVLDGDLDFDGSRRQNAEDVRAALGEAKQPDSVELHQRQQSEPAFASRTPEPASSEPEGENGEEEVDLVEQLYGSFSVRDKQDVAEYRAPEIHNRTADEKAWRKAEARKSLQQSRGLSIDDYASRMKMAAIMLAQLKASQQPALGASDVYGAVGSVIGGAGYVIGGAGTVIGGAVRATLGRQTDVDGQGASGLPAPLDISSAAPHVRQRVLSAQEAASIRERIMSEMMQLEEERMRRTVRETTQDETVVMRAVNKDDPSGAALQESWEAKRSRVRVSSPYGHLASWDIFSMIVKTGADLRQEQLAVQLIKEFGRIWTEVGLPHWVR